MWVIAWRPYDPGGIFVHGIGNIANHKENAVIAGTGVANALRFRSLGEAQMFFDSIKEMDKQGHTYWKEWIIVNLEDHDDRSSPCMH